MKYKLALLIGCTVVLHSSVGLFAQGTAFTYQGKLNDGINAAAGSYDLKFTILDSTNLPGVVIAGPLTNAATGVTNGLFTVTLDFGAGVFSGPDRFLEIGVRTNLGGSGSFATLNPRQKITATPYAITAGNLTGVVPAAGIAGTYSSTVSFNNPANSFSGNGGGLTNVNAATLGGLSSANFWKTAGNSGTSSGINFVGTTDNQALTLRVNNTIALQIIPGTTLPNVVGGLASFHPSVIASGVSGAVIAGGNAPSGGVNGFGGGDFHAVYDNDGAIGGGFGNKVGSNNADITDAAFATVAGGVFNSAAAYAATVAGGDGNFAGGQRSFIGSGFGNQAQGGFSVLSGGILNSILANADYTTIGGGNLNTIQASATNSTIAGGYSNVVQSSVFAGTIGGGIQNIIKLGTFGSVAATIAGGERNIIVDGVDVDPRWATIGGGFNNMVSEVGGTVSGGYQNNSSGAEASIGGGYQNVSSGGQATVAGGSLNGATGQQSTVGGGSSNTSTNSYSTIGGGSLNISGGFASTVSGGAQNSATGTRAVIGGGQFNIASGGFATIPGGEFITASGTTTFAAGFRAKAVNDGAFVWADTQFADFSSTANDSVSFRCLGGVRFTSGSGAANQTVSWVPGNGSWTFSSDRSLKEGFEAVDGLAVLEKIASLPVTEWNYKGYAQRHIGVMAQDFHSAFPLNDSTTTLNELDLHGVALAAIQGLNQKISAQAEVIQTRDTHISELEKRVERLEKLISATADKR